jgi:hypothetical protein
MAMEYFYNDSAFTGIPDENLVTHQPDQQAVVILLFTFS